MIITDSKYTETTNDITVSVKPDVIEDETSPERGVFTFEYTITIENRSATPAQLVERHWIIKSAEIVIGEVIGPGVVGVQPKINPGKSFTYTSSAVIHDPIGSMEGKYTFKREDGTIFEVRIPRFELRYALMVH